MSVKWQNCQELIGKYEEIYKKIKMETISELLKDKKKAEEEIQEIMSSLWSKYPKAKFKLYHFVEEQWEVEGIKSYDTQTKIMIEL